MKCKKCGCDLSEVIYDAEDDFRSDNFDGYYDDCSTLFIICPKCDKTYEIERGE